MNKTGMGHLFVKIAVIGCIVLAFGLTISATSRRIVTFHKTGLGLTREIFEMEALLSSRDLWEERAQWLLRNAPRFASEEEATNHLTDNLASSARQFGLNLLPREVKFPEKDPEPPTWNEESTVVFDRVNTGMAVSGEERAIVEWIHSIQSPENFRGIDHMTIEATGNGLLCEVQVTQWYFDWWRPVID